MTALLESSNGLVEDFGAYLGTLDRAERARALARAKMLGMRDASEEALNEPSGLLARRVDIGGLLREGIPPVEYLEGLFARRMVYAKGVTGFTGHPKSMKTTLVSRLALDAMAAGRYVVYLDWENGDEEVARRFLDLGAPADLLSERLVYLPFPGAPNWAEIGGIWDEFPDAVGIWDSTRGILRSLGLNEDKAAEVGQFLDPLVEFSLTRSVPSLLIDHVIKSATENTGYARGSGDKLAAVQAQWYVKCPTEITETEPGEIEVIRWAARSGRLEPALPLPRRRRRREPDVPASRRGPVAGSEARTQHHRVPEGRAAGGVLAQPDHGRSDRDGGHDARDREGTRGGSRPAGRTARGQVPLRRQPRQRRAGIRCVAGVLGASERPTHLRRWGCPRRCVVGSDAPRRTKAEFRSTTGVAVRRGPTHLRRRATAVGASSALTPVRREPTHLRVRTRPEAGRTIVHPYRLLTETERAAAWDAYDDLLDAACDARSNGWASWERDHVIAAARRLGVTVWPRLIERVLKDARGMVPRVG